jgi:hypothetical protein
MDGSAVVSPVARISVTSTAKVFTLVSFFATFIQK